ncbi:envelope stress response membrane protein PspC [Parasalinivibrio latis]|uniref:envelope stress response membrane protein PspC n=1 Tax=Parasalinivibrio latis TaxID=2952610 RepID=UPI0030E22092
MAKTLYRDPANGKLGGVCAGLAEYFDMEIWLVRILVVSAFLLGGGFFIIVAYVAAMLILEKMPTDREEEVLQQRQHQVKQKPWQSGQTPNRVLNDLEHELNAMELKVRDMEAYVTSSSFRVQREFSKL